MQKNRLSGHNIFSPLLGLAFSMLLAGSLIGSDKNLNEKTSSEKAHPDITSEKTAAMVNGKPIYVTQLDKAADRQLRKDRKYSVSGSHPAQIDMLRKKMLNQLINQEVLRQASLKEPVTDLDNKVKKEIELIKKQFGSKEKFQNYSPSKNMTDEQFTTFLKEKIHLNEYLKNHGVKDPDIPEKKIRDFYEQGKHNFKRGARIKVSHILLSVEQDADAVKKKETRENALMLRQMIVKGKDFAIVAKEHSDSEEANVTGGDLGFIKKGYMPAAFDEVAFALKQGEVSEPVATQFGYHIIKVTDKKPASFSSYEEVRDFIRKYLQEKEGTKKMASHMQKLRKEAKIEIVSIQSQN